VKHIENKYHKARDLVEKKLLQVRHVGNNGMVADVMNKGLGWVKFERFRSMLKVLPLRTCWSVERSHIKCIRNQWEFHLQGKGRGGRMGSHIYAGCHGGSHMAARTWVLETVTGLRSVVYSGSLYWA